jgi:hypothetical protein
MLTLSVKQLNFDRTASTDQIQHSEDSCNQHLARLDEIGRGDPSAKLTAYSVNQTVRLLKTEQFTASTDQIQLLTLSVKLFDLDRIVSTSQIQLLTVNQTVRVTLIESNSPIVCEGA